VVNVDAHLKAKYTHQQKNHVLIIDGPYKIKVMIKATKITDEELSQVKELRQNFNLVTFEFGELSLTRKLLQQELDKLDKDIENYVSTYRTLQDKEKELVDKLEKTYSDQTVNFETGELS
jgi:phage/plasmid-associated DNA primase